MSVKVEVRITECVNDSWPERFLLGSHYWSVRRLDTYQSEHGFARSEEKARKKAEKAAESLVSYEPDPVQTYELEV